MYAIILSCLASSIHCKHSTISSSYNLRIFTIIISMRHLWIFSNFIWKLQGIYYFKLKWNIYFFLSTIGIYIIIDENIFQIHFYLWYSSRSVPSQFSVFCFLTRWVHLVHFWKENEKYNTDFKIIVRLHKWPSVIKLQLSSQTLDLSELMVGWK